MTDLILTVRCAVEHEKRGWREQKKWTQEYPKVLHTEGGGGTSSSAVDRSSWRRVKTPTGLEPALWPGSKILPDLTTTTISYLFWMRSSMTRPVDVDVVTHGGGALIAAESGASSCTIAAKL